MVTREVSQAEISQMLRDREISSSDLDNLVRVLKARGVPLGSFRGALGPGMGSPERQQWEANLAQRINMAGGRDALTEAQQITQGKRTPLNRAQVQKDLAERRERREFARQRPIRERSARMRQLQREGKVPESFAGARVFRTDSGEAFILRPEPPAPRPELRSSPPPQVETTTIADLSALSPSLKETRVKDLTTGQPITYTPTDTGLKLDVEGAIRGPRDPARQTRSKIPESDIFIKKTISDPDIIRIEKVTQQRDIEPFIKAEKTARTIEFGLRKIFSEPKAVPRTGVRPEVIRQEELARKAVQPQIIVGSGIAGGATMIPLGIVRAPEGIVEAVRDPVGATTSFITEASTLTGFGRTIGTLGGFSALSKAGLFGLGKVKGSKSFRDIKVKLDKGPTFLGKKPDIKPTILAETGLVPGRTDGVTLPKSFKQFVKEAPSTTPPPIKIPGLGVSKTIDTAIRRTPKPRGDAIKFKKIPPGLLPATKLTSQIPKTVTEKATERHLLKQSIVSEPEPLPLFETIQTRGFRVAKTGEPKKGAVITTGFDISEAFGSKTLLSITEFKATTTQPKPGLFKVSIRGFGGEAEKVGRQIKGFTSKKSGAEFTIKKTVTGFDIKEGSSLIADLKKTQKTLTDKKIGGARTSRFRSGRGVRTFLQEEPIGEFILGEERLTTGSRLFAKERFTTGKPLKVSSITQDVSNFIRSPTGKEFRVSQQRGTLFPTPKGQDPSILTIQQFDDVQSGLNKLLREGTRRDKKRVKQILQASRTDQDIVTATDIALQEAFKTPKIKRASRPATRQTTRTPSTRINPNIVADVKTPEIVPLVKPIRSTRTRTRPRFTEQTSTKQAGGQDFIGLREVQLSLSQSQASGLTQAIGQRQKIGIRQRQEQKQSQKQRQGFRTSLGQAVAFNVPQPVRPLVDVRTRSEPLKTPPPIIPRRGRGGGGTVLFPPRGFGFILPPVTETPRPKRKKAKKKKKVKGGRFAPSVAGIVSGRKRKPQKILTGVEIRFPRR